MQDCWYTIPYLIEKLMTDPEGNHNHGKEWRRDLDVEIFLANHETTLWQPSSPSKECDLRKRRHFVKESDNEGQLPTEDTYICWEGEEADCKKIPHYTTSLDAKLPWENIVEVTKLSQHLWFARHLHYNGRHFPGSAPTEACARRAAALAAKASNRTL